MKTLGLISLLFSIAISAPSFALSCCVGGSSKGWLRLQRFQHYEMGVTTSLSDIYGYYNRYGELETFERDRTTGLALAGAMRLNADLQVSASVPFSYRSYGPDIIRTNSLGLGDINVQAEWMAVESLFREEWYPTISLFGGLKLPTGADGRLGTGTWDPYVGVAIDKGVGPLTASFRASYTLRFPHQDVREGNFVELSESLTYPFTRRFALTAGANQTWRSAKAQGGIELADSQGRWASLFVAPAYFLTQYVSFTASADFTIPVAGFGVNAPAIQSFGLTARYAIF